MFQKNVNIFFLIATIATSKVSAQLF